MLRYAAAEACCVIDHKRSSGRISAPKVILVGVMRKMITTLYVMLRDGASWRPHAA